MFGMSMDIGIDLGTANVLIYVKNKGIVLREPSVVAVDKDTNQVLAIGEEARRMIGRTPGNIVAIRPLKEGVIADYDITESMLRHFIEKVVGHSFVFRPRIMICIPSGCTMVEQRAVQEAAEQAGARHTQLIEEPLAAALGAGLDIVEPCGSMVVDIGGGTTDIAVISLGGIVTSASLRIAGDKFDADIIAYVKREFNMMIGERTAEDIKMNIGAAFPEARKEEMDIRGRDMLTGLPKNLTITTAQAAEARPGMVLTTTMFWALSTLVMLSRKMVRSFSAKLSLVRFPETAYLYTPWPTGSLIRCICLMSLEMVA